MSIERLDPSNEADARAVAELHSRYLGDSPIVQFGPTFLHRFFYRTLVRDGLVGVSLYRHEGKVIGFISYTWEPHGFMVKGVRRHPLGVAWALLLGILKRPATAVDIAKILRVMRERGQEQEAGDLAKTGEIITLVVEKEHRAHIPADGESRLAVRLFEDAREVLEQAGLEHIHLLVRPDNLESNIFCSSIGCTFGKISYGGETVHRFTYTIPSAAAGEAAS